MEIAGSDLTGCVEAAKATMTSNCINTSSRWDLIGCIGPASLKTMAARIPLKSASQLQGLGSKPNASKQRERGEQQTST